jgi:hypothetical protein
LLSLFCSPDPPLLSHFEIIGFGGIGAHATLDGHKSFGCCREHTEIKTWVYYCMNLLLVKTSLTR